MSFVELRIPASVYDQQEAVEILRIWKSRGRIHLSLKMDSFEPARSYCDYVDYWANTLSTVLENLAEIIELEFSIEYVYNKQQLYQALLHREEGLNASTYGVCFTRQ